MVTNKSPSPPLSSRLMLGESSNLTSTANPQRNDAFVITDAKPFVHQEVSSSEDDFGRSAMFD